MEFVQNIALSGVGISFILLIVARLIPNDKLRAIGVKNGALLSKWARGKMGFAWEKVETFIENSVSVYWSGFQEGLDSDDEKKDTSSGGVPPAAIILLILFFMPTMAKAESILFKFGKVSVHVPFARVDTTYLYDFLEKDGDKSSRWGGETPICNFPIPFTTESARLVIGATTDTIRKGDPFIGINKEVTKIVDQQFDIGVFAGKKTNSSEWMLGLKASLPLWGAP